MLGWLKRIRAFAGSAPKGGKRLGVRFLRARYDAAQTTDANRRHWAGADGLAADAAANPEVRRTLRNRARYEVANNSYARGIVLTLANDVIGTGARLQMLTESAEANQTLEREFAAWAKAVDLAGKLCTMRMARAQDGDAFGLLISNENLASPVQLDLRLIEADQVTTPGFAYGYAGAGPARHGEAQRSQVDGIVLDEFGNPAEYHVLKAHPGGGAAALGQECDEVPAESMVHWFRQDRPGQSRGLPDRGSVRIGFHCGMSSSPLRLTRAGGPVGVGSCRPWSLS